jgi:hypothetical protein
MKKYLLLTVAIVALCIGFSSCSKDEDEIPQISLQEIKSQLIGEWEELGYIKGVVFKEEAKFGSDGTFSYWFFNGWSNTKRVNGKWILKDEKTISITDEDGKTTDYYFTYELKSYDKNTISNIYISPMFRHNLYKK